MKEETKLEQPCFNKFSQWNYVIQSLKASASIYALAFWKQDHRLRISKVIIHFALSRSGVGLRVFMPAFGLLGIDFGHGFDIQDKKS
jgi:outer membrane protein insertion porin family